MPRDLETICLKCLEKQPKARYESAAGLAEDLERFLAGKAVQARPVRAWQRAGKWARRRPVHAALLAVSVITVSIVLGVVLWSGTWMRETSAKPHERGRPDGTRRAAGRAIRRTEPASNDALAEERERFAERYGPATQLKLRA